MQHSCIKWGEAHEEDEIPGGGSIQHFALRQKQIIQQWDAPSRNIGNNGVSLTFGYT